MIQLTRPQKPKILEEKAAEWTQKYIEKVESTKTQQRKSPRPDNSKYAHPHIKNTLAQMSYQKCFYCEGALEPEAWVDQLPPN